MAKLENFIGKQIVFAPSETFAREKKKYPLIPAKLVGVEESGIWIESPDLTADYFAGVGMTKADIERLQRKALFFFPFRAIFFLSGPTPDQPLT